MKRLYLALAVLVLFAPAHANAFQHVVTNNETLAQIALRYYGSSRFEAAIVGANALDAYGGSAIMAGQPLEIPAPSHHRTKEGDTWFSLARSLAAQATRTCARSSSCITPRSRRSSSRSSRSGPTTSARFASR